MARMKWPTVTAGDLAVRADREILPRLAARIDEAEVALHGPRTGPTARRSHATGGDGQPGPIGLYRARGRTWAQLVSQGATRTDIASRHGVTARTVGTAIDRYGMGLSELPSNGRARQAELWADADRCHRAIAHWEDDRAQHMSIRAGAVDRLLAAGVPAAEVADLAGCTPEALRAARRKHSKKNPPNP